MQKEYNGSIAVEHGPAGSYIVCQCTGEPNDMDWSESDSILFQLDWDFPSLASAFGFIPCDCGETDGTVDCKHHTAGDMIESATTYLDDCVASGKTAVDPGYFAF